MKKPINHIAILFLAAFFGAVTDPAAASGTIGYGSRAGMEVTVLSVSGLDTDHALIRTKHTRANAIAYCRDYVQKVTKNCINEELSVRLNDSIRANCELGTFTDFFGTRYQLRGPNPDPDGNAKYLLVNLDTKEVADGSSASGYPTNMLILRSLCPRTAPSDY